MSDAAAPAMPEAGEQPRQPAKRQPLVVRITNPRPSNSRRSIRSGGAAPN